MAASGKAAKSKEPAQEGIPLTDDATHDQIAQFLLIEMDFNTGNKPVGAEGQLWQTNRRKLWTPISAEQLAVVVGSRMLKFKRCTKVNDYNAIARYAIARADAPDFFAAAPVGVVCPGGLWQFDASELKRVVLCAEHRQRFAISIDPDFEGEAPLFDGLLRSAFEGEDVEAQQDLAAELVGLALFGLAARQMVVGLLLGPGASGKSTFLNIVQELFPPHFVAAVSPSRWDHEYYCAGLAGKRLNVVGEVPDDRPLPAAAFKNVTGGDLLEGRHPTHRPFYFRCEAGHFFNANQLPATTDRSDAFFRRWRVLKFSKVVPTEQRDPDLARKIIDGELPMVLAWAMRGAERVVRRGRVATSKPHDDVMNRWCIGSNPVLLFLTDPDFAQLDADGRERSVDVYASYRRWAQEHGNRPLSSQGFLQILDGTAASMGVVRGRDAAARYISGVRLLHSQGVL